jgi:hypothetical protein
MEWREMWRCGVGVGVGVIGEELVRDWEGVWCGIIDAVLAVGVVELTEVVVWSRVLLEYLVDFGVGVGWRGVK